MSRCVTPPLFMSSPARMNSGIDSSAAESTLVSMVSGSITASLNASGPRQDSRHGGEHHRKTHVHAQHEQDQEEHDDEERHRACLPVSASTSRRMQVKAIAAVPTRMAL